MYVRVWREGEMQSWVIARRGRQVVKWYRDEGGAGAEGVGMAPNGQGRDALDVSALSGGVAFGKTVLCGLWVWDAVAGVCPARRHLRRWRHPGR